jgi:hypothetical protein
MQQLCFQTMTKLTKTNSGQLRLIVYCSAESDPRVFDLPLLVTSAADQERAVTIAAHAFAQAFDEDVRRAGKLQATQEEIYMDREALCQSCLRVCPAHETTCKCGGETCSCRECLKAIGQLRAGERSMEALELLVEISDWNEQCGAVINESPQSILTTL